MINGYIITIGGNPVSEEAALKARNPSPENLNMITFSAVTPRDVGKLLMSYNLIWRYPWQGEELDIKSGLLKRAYPTTNQEARIACFLSHYQLWLKCARYDKPIVIMEHDVSFFDSKPLPLEDLRYSRYDIIGLNSPRYATRLSQVYHEELQKNDKAIARVPYIDQMQVPQGLAGNSCYYIEPSGANKLLSLVREHGCWPNDAIMCRQLISTLGATRKYYSTVQRTPSTTT